MAIAPMTDLSPGNVKINVAEFIAALITCESFEESCTEAITTIELDNITAMVRMQTAICPRNSFDRAAQGAYFQMLEIP